MNVEDIFDEETGILDLSKLDKNKKYIIFYKKTCSGCHQAMTYMTIHDIKYDAYDLDTPNGLAVACVEGVIENCMRLVPVIIENNGN